LRRQRAHENSLICKAFEAASDYVTGWERDERLIIYVPVAFVKLSFGSGRA
jgi:hypothetical protein